MPEDNPTETPSSMDQLRTELSGMIEGVRTESRDLAIKAVSDFAKQVEGERSRTAPIPAKDAAPQRSDSTLDYQRELRVMGDARYPLYRKMENDRSPDQVLDLRAARNPGMDELTKQWCQAVYTRDISGRIHLYDQMNDLYIEDSGLSRAALLEGAADASSGFAAGTGGELLPLPLSNQLYVARDRMAKFRGLVTSFPMTTQTSRIPVLPTAPAATRAENFSYADNTPAADSALLTATDLGVEFSAGRNFLEDTGFNMANQLTVVAGGAIGKEEDIQIATSTGAGSGITEGLDGATIQDLPEATPSALALVDFITLYYTMPEVYRANCKWFMTGTTLIDVMAIVDGNSRPMFMSPLEAVKTISDTDPKAEGAILGKPVYDVPVADDVVYFGDPAWYALGDRMGVRVDVDRDVSTGATTWVIDERLDGRVIPTGLLNTNSSWLKTIY